MINYKRLEKSSLFCGPINIGCDCMSSVEREKSLLYWDNIHKDYNREDIKIDDWLDKFSNIIDNCSTPVLDLGCGSGNDTLYLIKKGKEVISCD